MNETTAAVSYKPITVKSTAFKDNEMIPPKYTCDGINVSPPLKLMQIPSKAKSLAIIVDDPDAPGGTWVHWVMWNIPVTNLVDEGHTKGMNGINDFRNVSYCGPCPPSSIHHYHFKVYALDNILTIPAGSSKTDLEQAMEDHVLGFGLLIGLYSRKKSL